MADLNAIARKLGELGRRKAKYIAKLDQVAREECDVLHELMEHHRVDLDDDAILAAAAPKNEPPPPRRP